MRNYNPGRLQPKRKSCAQIHEVTAPIHHRQVINPAPDCVLLPIQPQEIRIGRSRINVAATTTTMHQAHRYAFALPVLNHSSGASGALVKMSGASSGGNSVMIYFNCKDCGAEPSKAALHGGTVMKTKFSLGKFGFAALITDTEGNVVGFHSMTCPHHPTTRFASGTTATPKKPRSFTPLPLQTRLSALSTARQETFHRAKRRCINRRVQCHGVPCPGINGWPAVTHNMAFSFQVATAD